MLLGIGGAYGHNFLDLFLGYLVCLDEVDKHDVVREVSSGALHKRLKNGSYHDFLIDWSITPERWLQIKRFIKIKIK